MTNPWLSEGIAAQQRALVDQQLQQSPPPPHFQALVAAFAATRCPGDVLVVGCGTGHEREVIDRAASAGVNTSVRAYRSWAGIDISPEAIRLAKERYPESEWECDTLNRDIERDADVVVDSACLMHVDDWRAHLASLCWASRRFVILHRVPLAPETTRTETHGYGHAFPAWSFSNDELLREMMTHGYRFMNAMAADGDSRTYVFTKPRHWVSYCDSAYLTRLKALHASMVRHVGPFELHVLAWDQGVADWCLANGVAVTHIARFLHEHMALDVDVLPGPPRTRVEHMWTVGPQWIADVMERTGEPVCYVDSDILFFSSPEPVFAETGGAPAAVVPHGFVRAAQGLPGPTAESHSCFGLYNVGFLHVADRSFAERWAQQTAAWCYDRPQWIMHGEKTSLIYGDQVFLNDWPERGAHVVQHPGACAGPWQAHTRSLDVRDGVVHFGNRPLVSWHFSGYRELPDGHTVMTRPEYMLTRRQEEIIYTPFIRALEEAKR